MVVFSLYTLQKDSLTSNREIREMHTGKRYVTTTNSMIQHSHIHNPRSASQSAIKLIRSEVPERDTGADAAAEASAMRVSIACPADANDACAVAAIAAGFFWFLSLCSCSAR